MAFVAEKVEYHTTWLASFFHSFPRVDLSFESTSANFTPRSRKYIEALGFWAGIPVIWCGILWLAFLVFFCYRCFSKSQIKQSRAICARLGTAFFLLLGCGAVVVTFIANAQVDNGIDDFVGAVNSVNKTIEGSRGVVNTLDRIVSDTELKALPELRKAVSGITNVTAHTMISDLLNQILTNINPVHSLEVSLRGDAQQVDTEQIVHTTQNLEYYRWMATILVNCVYTAIFVLTFTALIKKSRWMLMLAAVCAIICKLVIWLTTSFYIFIGIGGGDLCVDPDHFVVSQVNGTVKQDLLLDYIRCDDSSQPYQEEIMQAQTDLTQAMTTLNRTVNITQPFNISDKISGPVTHLRNNLRFMFGNLSSLTVQVGGCQAIHDEYITALQGVCYTALEGVGYLILFSALIGMASTFMIVFLAKTWPHCGKRRRRCQGHEYTRIDDSDPFLPDPPPYQRSYGTMTQAHNTAESRLQADDVMTNEEVRPVMNMGGQGESPPPAYQPGHYMQQYYSLAPTPSNVAHTTNPSA